MTDAYYDSAHRDRPLVDEITKLWAYRGLLRLLVVRDVSLRYKRSLLGPWWTLLNPLLTMSVLWLVFSQLFRLSTPGVPYAVYVLSGVVLMTFFQQSITAAGNSIVNSADVLSKIYVPAEIYALSAAAADAANFGISLIPFVLLEIVTGIGIPWTIVLVPIFCIPLLAFATGCGLLVAAAAVRFYDAIDLTRVALFIAVYTTATFYPVSILSSRVRTAIQFNPLFHYMVVFRRLVYEGRIGSWPPYAVIAVTSLVMFTSGVSVFVRSWRRLVIML